MERNIKTKFSIGQEVYHITPDSPKGIVIDIAYYFATNEVKYIVAWGHSDESFYREIELTEHKTF